MTGRISRLTAAIALAVSMAAGSVALVAQEQAPAPATAQPLSFADWLAELRKEALAAGISERTVTAALTDVEPLPVVTERDRAQPERVLSLDQYLKRRLDRKTMKTAREMAKKHRDELAKVSARYGVPRQIIVAVWGLESNFGRFSGVRPTITALATLAFDNRRSALFHQELMNALRILDKGDIDLATMKGSWAGAMGQPQFLPSSYLKYAEDFNGDGKRDIWGTEVDVFASIANYLKQNGWTTGAAWGRPVSVPASAVTGIEKAAPLRTVGCEAMRQMSEGLALSKWRRLGVKGKGGALPNTNAAASLVRAGSRSFLVYDNYSVLLQYNCAHAYALAVGLLADSIR